MLKTKIYQMFITGTGSNLDYFLSNGLGGVIFFAKDIVSQSQFVDLVSDIKNKSVVIPPFLSIDQEGGRVERTENISPLRLSAKYAFEKGKTFLQKQTETMADELKSFGINMNFSPCLDVNSNPDNPVIGERAFSDLPQEVCAGYDIVSKVYSNNEIIPVIKHFPGHGDANADSHKELPEIDLSMKNMEEIHILPFKHAIERGADAVMVAHLHCSCFDKEIIPTSLSRNCINYLKEVLKFKGLIISDDMYMKGVAKFGMTEACIMGIKAGINLFIYRDASDITRNVIESVIENAARDCELRDCIEDSYNKIIRLKQKYNLI